MNTYKVRAAFEVEPHTWKYDEFIVSAPTSYLATKTVRNDLSNKYGKVKILYTEKLVRLSAGANAVLRMF